MQHADFEEVVWETVAELPHWVQEAMRNVEILVLDKADDHLDPDGEGLLGLYTGVPLPEREANHAGELPDVIYIFRLPHLELGLQLGRATRGNSSHACPRDRTLLRHG